MPNQLANSLAADPIRVTAPAHVCRRMAWAMAFAVGCLTATVVAGCGSSVDPGTASDAVIEGQKWRVPRSLGWAGNYTNRVTLSDGASSTSIALMAADQCELKQFGLSAAWRNASDPFGNFSPLRVTFSIGQTVDPAAAYGPPVVGTRYAFGDDGFLGLDGIGYRARMPGACEAEVVGYYNEAATGQAGIALSFTDCRLTSSAGDVKIMDGEAFCETGSFTPIDLPIDPPTTDAGIDSMDGGGSDAAQSSDAGDSDAAQSSDAGDSDAGDSDAGDPCMATCAATEVCVAGACRTRAEQTQPQYSSGCGDANRACDAGEDDDCAADHACVGGLCRRLSCQTQPQYSGNCGDAFRPCDGDDNTDCAADHACVGGLCRRLSCQTQPQYSGNCGDAFRPCDSNDNTDCAADHACAGGLCRRLSCQTQSQYSGSCGAAIRVCDIGDDDDCAPNHDCSSAGFCHRDGCPAPF